MADKVLTDDERKEKSRIKYEKEKQRRLENPEKYALKDKIKMEKYYIKNHELILERQKADRINNPDRHKAKQKKYLETNTEQAKENRRIWTENNIDKIREQNRLSLLKHRDKQNAHRKHRRKIDPIYRAKCYQWSKDNLDRRRFSGAKRRAAKLNATPPWLTKDDWNEIRRFYKVASYLTKKIGIKYVVDHIHPLQGANVCGLHVPWNLQILTDEENTSKGIKVRNF